MVKKFIFENALLHLQVGSSKIQINLDFSLENMFWEFLLTKHNVVSLAYTHTQIDF